MDKRNPAREVNLGELDTVDECTVADRRDVVRDLDALQCRTAAEEIVRDFGQTFRERD